MWLIVTKQLATSKVHATNTYTHTQLFNSLLSGTTRLSRYQKKHSPTHTHPDDLTSFIIFLHLQRSMASSWFSLRAWQSSQTTSLQVLFGPPLGLGPSTSYSMHFFTQSSSAIQLLYISITLFSFICNFARFIYYSAYIRCKMNKGYPYSKMLSLSGSVSSINSSAICDTKTWSFFHTGHQCIDASNQSKYVPCHSLHTKFHFFKLSICVKKVPTNTQISARK